MTQKLKQEKPNGAGKRAKKPNYQYNGAQKREKRAPRGKKKLRGENNDNKYCLGNE